MTLRKGFDRSVAVKLRNALGLVMRCDKLIEHLARKRGHGSGLRQVNLAIDDRTHDGEIAFIHTRLLPAIYFCLHRGSLPENAASLQPQFSAGIMPDKVSLAICHVKSHSDGNVV